MRGSNFHAYLRNFRSDLFRSTLWTNFLGIVYVQYITLLRIYCILCEDEHFRVRQLRATGDRIRGAMRDARHVRCGLLHPPLGVALFRSSPSKRARLEGVKCFTLCIARERRPAGWPVGDGVGFRPSRGQRTGRVGGDGDDDHADRGVVFRGSISRDRCLLLPESGAGGARSKKERNERNYRRGGLEAVHIGEGSPYFFGHGPREFRFVTFEWRK